MPGQISVLVSQELQVLLSVTRTLPRTVAAQLRAHTKNTAHTIWRDEIDSTAMTRLQTVTLSRTARVAVSDTNVTLKSATTGKVGHSKTLAVVIANAVEFGANPNKIITVNHRGTQYKRRIGNTFGAPTRSGKTVHPAAANVTPRLASLWFQTTLRTIAETLERSTK